MPRLLELCCGSKSVSKYFEAQGWECVTVDIDKKFEPTIIADVRDIDPPNTWKAGEFDVVWCSPPCTFFSTARSRAPMGLQISGPDCPGLLGYHSASNFGSNQECFLVYGEPSKWISQDALVHAGVRQ